jgi:hypothetical protein
MAKAEVASGVDGALQEFDGACNFQNSGAKYLVPSHKGSACVQNA